MEVEVRGDRIQEQPGGDGAEQFVVCALLWRLRAISISLIRAEPDRATSAAAVAAASIEAFSISAAFALRSSLLATLK